MRRALDLVGGVVEAREWRRLGLTFLLGAGLLALATLVATGGLVVAVTDLNRGEFAAPLLAVAFAALWGSEPRRGPRRRVFEPVPLGLGFGLLVVSLVTLRFATFGGTTGSDIANAVRVAVLLAALGYVLIGVLDDTGTRGARRQASLAIARRVADPARPRAGHWPA